MTVLTGKCTRQVSVAVAALATQLVVGCHSREVTRIELTTFDQGGTPQHHYAEFSRASYRRSPGGNVDIVLRSDRPSSIDPTQSITQIVYVRSFWNPIPGTTYADGSQINAQVQYALLTPPTGIRYDGAAFLAYHTRRRTGQLVGTLEDGSLAPRCRMGDAAEPFGPCRLTGTFFATENPAEVVRTAAMLESQFPQPIGPR